MNTIQKFLLFTTITKSYEAVNKYLYKKLWTHPNFAFFCYQII